jgi:mannitol-specific phosphotransferase system IIBC component
MTLSSRYRLPVIAGAITVALGLIVAVVTLTPISGRDVPGSDKIHHALGFAVLAFPMSLVRPRLAVAVALCVMAYGGVIELVQPHFGRQAEWADFVADIAGAAAGAAVGALAGVGRARWRRPPAPPRA